MVEALKGIEFELVSTNLSKEKEDKAADSSSPFIAVGHLYLESLEGG